MPVSCCVVNCTNRFEKSSRISFYRIPEKEPKRSAWINAFRRKQWNPTAHTRVCSTHFLSELRWLSGKPNDISNDPDFVPNLLMGYMENGELERSLKKKKRHLRTKQHAETKNKVEEERERTRTDQLQGAEILLELSMSIPAAPCEETSPPIEEINVDGDDQQKEPDRCDELQKENKMLYKELERLQEENRELKLKLQQAQFNEQFLVTGNSEFKTHFFTGFPNFGVFSWALALCAPVLPTSKVLSQPCIFS
uniref:THAP domain-containing protein 1-like n=1 Tax=Myxine glutinosa TaxID=7769 RepID=UPI00358E83E8